MSDIVIARIRTIVPGIIAAALTWLASTLDIVISSDTVTAVIGLVMTVILAVWYIVVSWLEKKVGPAWGWLLGYPKRPTYDTTGQEH